MRSGARSSGIRASLFAALIVCAPRLARAQSSSPPDALVAPSASPAPSSSPEPLPALEPALPNDALEEAYAARVHDILDHFAEQERRDHLVVFIGSEVMGVAQVAAALTMCLAPQTPSMETCTWSVSLLPWAIALPVIGALQLRSGNVDRALRHFDATVIHRTTSVQRAVWQASDELLQAQREHPDQTILMFVAAAVGVAAGTVSLLLPTLSHVPMNAGFVGYAIAGYGEAAGILLEGVWLRTHNTTRAAIDALRTSTVAPSARLVWTPTLVLAPGLAAAGLTAEF